MLHGLGPHESSWGGGERFSCEVGFSYHLTLGPLFGECPNPRALGNALTLELYVTLDKLLFFFHCNYRLGPPCTLSLKFPLLSFAIRVVLRLFHLGDNPIACWLLNPRAFVLGFAFVVPFFLAPPLFLPSFLPRSSAVLPHHQKKTETKKQQPSLRSAD